MPKHQRARDHETARKRRQLILDNINIHTNYRIDWRAGADGQDWEDGAPMNDTTRTMAQSPNSTYKRVGLDTIVTAPNGQLRWTVLFPWCPSDRKELPGGSYLRSKASEKGEPDEKQVRGFFSNQWAIIAYLKEEEDVIPLKIACFPFTWFLDEGYSNWEEKVMIKGFSFPKHKGRINTVHWFNKCWAYRTQWGFNEDMPGIRITARSIQSTIDTMFL